MDNENQSGEKRFEYINRFIFNEELGIELRDNEYKRLNTPTKTFYNKLEDLLVEIYKILETKNHMWRLKNPDAIYVNKEYLDLLGFLDTLPKTNRYKIFRVKTVELRNKIDKSLISQKLFREGDDINLNEIGLGWIKPKRKLLNYLDSTGEIKTKKYSTDHFFYIPSKGYIYTDISEQEPVPSQYFELCIDRDFKEPDLYYIKNINDLDNQNNNDGDYVTYTNGNKIIFKLILTGNDIRDESIPSKNKILFQEIILKLFNCNEGDITENNCIIANNRRDILYIKNN